MERDLDRLASEQFDVLVLGGGIYGAFVAWDAAARGLSVGLVEKSDFMSGTSSNSLKVLHGGLRYLPDLRPDRVRRMVVERRAMMRLAPHLIRPMPFVLPSHGRGTLSQAALALGLGLNDALAMDRNRELPPELHLPPGRLLSPSEFRLDFPDYESPEPIRGAALWYDAQIVDTERFGISVLKSANAEGACLANYVEATGIRIDGTRTGANLLDRLTGEAFQVRSRLVINACGPWAFELLGKFGIGPRQRHIGRSLAINAVVDRTAAQAALGIPVRGPGQDGPSPQARNALIFLVPWRGGSIIGTIHAPHKEGWPQPTVFEPLLDRLIGAVSGRLPNMGLTLSDVRLVHKGLLPAQLAPLDDGRVRLIRDGFVIDHSAQGHAGLLTIVGVKFTCARQLAEKAVDLAVGLLHAPVRNCQTKTRTLVGGDLGSLPSYVEDQARIQGRSLSRPLVDKLVRSYGTGYKEVLAEVRDSSTGSSEPALGAADVMKAKVRHAVRAEMAQELDDVILRRIGIGADGFPSQLDLAVCANEMARLKSWSSQETERQIEQAAGAFREPVLAA